MILSSTWLKKFPIFNLIKPWPFWAVWFSLDGFFSLVTFNNRREEGRPFCGQSEWLQGKQKIISCADAPFFMALKWMGEPFEKKKPAFEMFQPGYKRGLCWIKGHTHTHARALTCDERERRTKTRSFFFIQMFTVREKDHGPSKPFLPSNLFLFNILCTKYNSEEKRENDFNSSAMRSRSNNTWPFPQCGSKEVSRRKKNLHTSLWCQRFLLYCRAKLNHKKLFWILFSTRDSKIRNETCCGRWPFSLVSIGRKNLHDHWKVNPDFKSRKIFELTLNIWINTKYLN